VIRPVVLGALALGVLALGFLAFHEVTANRALPSAAEPSLSRSDSSLMARSDSAEQVITDGERLRPASADGPGQNDDSRVVVLSDASAQLPDEPVNAQPGTPPAPRLDILESSLERYHKRLAIDIEHDLPEVFEHARSLQMYSILTTLTLTGDYRSGPGAGGFDEAKEGQTSVVFWGGRRYVIDRSKYPLYFALQEHADNPGQQVTAEEKASLLDQVEIQYSEALGLLPSHSK